VYAGNPRIFRRVQSRSCNRQSLDVRCDVTCGLFSSGKREARSTSEYRKKIRRPLSSSLLSPGLTGKCPLNVSRILADNSSDDTTATILVTEIIKATTNFTDGKAGQAGAGPLAHRAGRAAWTVRYSLTRKNSLYYTRPVKKRLNGGSTLSPLSTEEGRVRRSLFVPLCQCRI